MAFADGGKREWRRVIVLLLLLFVPGAARAQERIDLNRATVAELQTLPSIGPVLAQRIVEHRRKHGPFRRPPEILAIRGLSARKYRQIAHLLTTR
jgi:DNA uptake protein ComE-like DNA-binding protein